MFMVFPKAACVCNGIGPKKVTKPLPYPRYKASMSRMDWVNKVLNDKKEENDTPAEKHNYGALDEYWKSKKNKKAHFVKLCEKHNVCSDDRDLLLACYKYLTQSIRNRDAHTYVACARRRDFPAVKPIFVPAFNVLVETLKQKGHPV